MRFLGGKRKLKNNGNDNSNEISGFAPGFGQFCFGTRERVHFRAE
jgi:hypothetical protein